jgi:putative hydrolase of HD superfamily
MAALWYTTCMTSAHPTIERLTELQQFIADFSKVTRILQLPGTNRLENDVDHSFGLALTCWYLAPKIAPELSLEKVFKYALSHDIVELYASDTFIFAHPDQLASKSDREDAAIDQLRADWPDFTDMVEGAKDYKDKIDEEAKFVKAVDKILPLLLIELGEGAAFWSHHKITLDMMREIKVTIKVSDHIAPYYEKVLAWLEQRDNMHKPAA